jgi:hypothetical protein
MVVADLVMMAFEKAGIGAGGQGTFGFPSLAMDLEDVQEIFEKRRITVENQLLTVV